MKKIFMALVGMVSLCAFDCFAAHDPVALHDRGNQKLIGDLEVTGKVTANEIAMPGGVSIGGTNACRPGWVCVSNARKLQKNDIVGFLEAFSGLSNKEATNLLSTMENAIYNEGYEAFDLNYACKGEHSGAFGEGSIVVCGKTPLEVSSASVGTLMIETARVNGSLTARAATITGGLTAGSLYTSGGLAVNGVSAVNQLSAHTATFDRAPVIPLVRYGLEIHAEYSGEIPVCTEEQSAAFVEAIQIFIENNLPEASLIAYECGRWFSIISPVMLEDFPTAKMTVFDMFDGVLIKHYIPNYYEDQGGAFQKMNCGADGRGAIAVAVDAKGAALVDCRVKEGQEAIYRRYAPESTIQF